MSDIADKMLFISMSDAANGAENVLLMAAKASKAPIIFLKKLDEGSLQIPEGIVHKYATKKSMFAGFLNLIILLFPYRKGYVLMSTHPYLNAYLGVLKRIGYLRSPLVVRECTSVFNRYSGLKKMSYKLAYHLGYPAVSCVVCQTELMRQQFLEHVPFIGQSKVIVLDNPVDLDLIINKAKIAINDPYLGAEFICAAGRLIPEKGFAVLIGAFSRIAKEYPELRLLLFGDGPQKAFLNKLIAAYGLTTRVIVKGWTKNPVPYFKSARVCVVSSIKEGFPNVLLEMMSVNPIVVSTLCAGGIESIPGILTANVNDINHLAAVIKKALSTQPKNNRTKLNGYLSNRTPAKFIEAVNNAL